MVKMPEPAPRKRLGSNAFERILEALEDGQLRDAFSRADKAYLYWDKFKHLSLPSGIRAEDAWVFLKATRMMSRRSTPIKDVRGKRFSYILTDEVQRCLHIIDKQAGGSVTVDAMGLPENDRQRYLIGSLMEEAIASSQLEGAATTRQAAKDMLREKREPRDRSERMIMNNYRTISVIKELLTEPVSPGLINDLQSSMTEGTLRDSSESGRCRRADENIVVADSQSRILHVPPHASGIPQEMQRLCAYINDSREGDFVHPVVEAVILHFWLAYLHPYTDGNGRTARALFYLHMLKRGYWVFEYLSISRIILGCRAQYERAFLHTESDDCDLTYFLNFHLHTIVKALGQLREYIEYKTEEDRRMRTLLQEEKGLNFRQRAVLSRALRLPETVFMIESHRTSHNISYGTAHNDLLGLVDKGYLDYRRVRRTFLFTARRDLRERMGAGITAGTINKVSI